MSLHSHCDPIYLHRHHADPCSDASPMETLLCVLLTIFIFHHYRSTKDVIRKFTGALFWQLSSG